MVWKIYLQSNAAAADDDSNDDNDDDDDDDAKRERGEREWCIVSNLLSAIMTTIWWFLNFTKFTIA